MQILNAERCPTLGDFDGCSESALPCEKGPKKRVKKVLFPKPNPPIECEFWKTPHVHQFARFFKVYGTMHTVSSTLKITP